MNGDSEDETERSGGEWAALKQVFVTQKEQGEFAVKVEKRFGEHEAMLAAFVQGQKTNRNILSGIAVGVLIDALLTIARWFLPH